MGDTSTADGSTSADTNSSGTGRLAILLCVGLGAWLFVIRPSTTLVMPNNEKPDRPQTKQSEPAPAPRRKRIAVGFHGAYDRKGSEFDRFSCSDFFQVSDNIESQLLAPLRRSYDVTTFFHTYRHLECRDKDDALEAFLRPASHKFSDAKLPRIIDSYLVVIDLIMDAAYGSREPALASTNDTAALRALPSDIEYVVLARFDVRYKVPFARLNVEMDKVNFAFRDRKAYWKRRRKVSDLFFVMPIHHLAPFRKALDASCCARWEAAESERKAKKKKQDDQNMKAIGPKAHAKQGAKESMGHRKNSPKIGGKGTMAHVHQVAVRLEQARNHRANSLLRNSNASNATLDLDEDCPGLTLGPACPGHFVYPGLIDAIGEKSVNFIDKGFRTSNIQINTDRNHRGPRRDPNEDAFLAIDRTCSGHHADLLAAKSYKAGKSEAGCWRGHPGLARSSNKAP
jgi:hypothetical protein